MNHTLNVKSLFKKSQQMRVATAMQLVPSLFFAIVMLLLPDTPRWYLMFGDEVAASAPRQICPERSYSIDLPMSAPLDCFFPSAD